MNPNNAMQEMLELLDAHRDGASTPAQQARLRELLAQSAEARRLFVQEQMLDAAFHLTPTPSLAEVVRPAIDRAATETAVGSRIPWRWAAAAALVFALGLGFGEFFKRPAPPSFTEIGEAMDDGIALLAQAVDAVWEGDRQPQAGSILAAGKLRLASGLAQIEFYSGARLILEGPVELDLVSARQVDCQSGRIRALVPPQARGFRVTVPEFELVDLGTEFGIEVGAGKGSKVQVFDGEVELFAPGTVQKPAHRLLGGAGLSWQTSGAKTEFSADAASFPSFDEVRRRTDAREKRQFAAWQEWNRSVQDDPRIAVRYTFEPNGTVLRDHGDLQANGSIIGCDWTNGRWADKDALEFKRPSDRVRVNIPGEYDALTFAAWIRVDATPERHMALLLTDGFEVARPHWQIAPPGDLRLGLRIPSAGPKRETTNYSAPDVISLGRLGVWSFVATVYDRRSGRVKHYLNGRQVASAVIRFDQPLTIGSAEIGNWGVTLGKGTHPVRNFIGRMDELTLWKVALGAEEIRDIFLKTRP